MKKNEKLVYLTLIVIPGNILSGQLFANFFDNSKLNALFSEPFIFLRDFYSFIFFLWRNPIFILISSIIGGVSLFLLISKELYKKKIKFLFLYIILLTLAPLISLIAPAIIIIVIIERKKIIQKIT